MIELPKVDQRSSADVAREVLAELRLDRLSSSQLKGRLDVALVHVFSRFSEIVIDRLNRAPEKKFLAFLDLLGVSPLPMEAASVPLTFYLAGQPGDHALVRAGTQVAAPPATQADPKPIIFETQSDLAVTSTVLAAIYVRNERDEYAELSSALPPVPDAHPGTAAAIADAACVPLFEPVPHLFYVAVPCNPAWPTVNRISLNFDVQPGLMPAGPLDLQWEIPSGAPGENALALVHKLLPAADTTEGLRQSGKVEFISVPATRTMLIGTEASCWIGCRLLAPLSGNRTGVDAESNPQTMPRITTTLVECEHGRNGLPLEQGFYEKQALDPTKAMFPFGQRPRLGDAFYLGCREAFSEQGASVTLHLELLSSAPAESSVPLANPNRVELCWEFWTGEAWALLNPQLKSLRIGSDGEDSSADATASNFSDGTGSLSHSGDVSFTLPAAPAELSLNGMKNYWVRARIAGGDYGHETQVVRDPATAQLSTVPGTLEPPCIRTVKIDYSIRRSAKPEVVSLNAWQVSRIASGMSFEAFSASTPDAAKPALYLGFRPPKPIAPQSSPPAAPNAKSPLPPFPRLPVNAYVLLDETTAQSGMSDVQTIGAVWEYWTATGWKRFTVADQTQGLRKSGLLQFLVPADFAPCAEFGQQAHWLRMQIGPGWVPSIRAVLLNSTLATEGVTVRNELLGSSNGRPRQRFRAISSSVLPGQLLEVCEPTLPSVAEQQALRRDSHVEDFVRPTSSDGSQKGYWIPWSEVATLNASGPRDRHYVLDHTTGEVLFGDGASGMIPPILPGNIRLTHYRSGGGSRGNQPAQAIRQLVSAVPYVQKVVNWVPSCGGNDREPDGTIFERGPRTIRHRGRAVTMEDYEDLAMSASREVARARCVPESDLSRDPMARLRRPGVISVVIVPRTEDAKPLAGLALREQVTDYLDARRLATAELVVVGPNYVRVDVEAEVAVNRPELASDVEQRVAAALREYLHPLRGGPSHSGWEFGRMPQRSDLYVLIERIPDVSHVGNLNLIASPDLAGIEKTRHFLIYCGRLTLTMTL